MIRRYDENVAVHEYIVRIPVYLIIQSFRKLKSKVKWHGVTYYINLVIIIQFHLATA